MISVHKVHEYLYHRVATKLSNIGPIDGKDTLFTKQ